MSLFITFEGPEGGGKTTQAAALAAHLEEQDFAVLLTREPGGTVIGEQIRQVLTALDNTAMTPQAEVLLFSASRAQHVHELIRPHLDAGGVVISDRFYDATFAYQGYGHQLDLPSLRAITAFATQGLSPDLTLLLDLPIEEGLARRREGGDWNRLDAYQQDFHRRVRAGYLELARAEPERWVVIDARQDMGRVQEQVRAAVSARLNEQRPA